MYASTTAPDAPQTGAVPGIAPARAVLYACPDEPPAGPGLFLFGAEAAIASPVAPAAPTTIEH